MALALQKDGWFLRSDVIWGKPNPMPESVTDRPTKSHEYLFLLAKSERYHYDAAAIAEPVVAPLNSSDWTTRKAAGATGGCLTRGASQQQGVGVSHDLGGWNGTRNRRSVWTIATQAFAEAHFAVMPEALVEPCVLAGSAPGDLVLDPFAGSGTVGVVALRYGRRFVGIDANAEYVEMARRRIAGPLFAEQGGGGA